MLNRNGLVKVFSFYCLMCVKLQIVMNGSNSKWQLSFNIFVFIVVMCMELENDVEDLSLLYSWLQSSVVIVIWSLQLGSLLYALSAIARSYCSCVLNDRSYLLHASVFSIPCLYGVTLGMLHSATVFVKVIGSCCRC